jgi:hypothetical protein
VGFGGDPRGLSTSTAVVARLRGVSFDDFDDGLYLRGTIYDVVTFDAFAQSAPDTTRATISDTRPSLPDLARSGDADVGYDVLLMPVAGPVVFTLGATRTALATSGGGANPNRPQPIGGRDRHDQLRTPVPLAASAPRRCRRGSSTSRRARCACPSSRGSHSERRGPAARRPPRRHIGRRFTPRRHHCRQAHRR